jgi:phosphatidylethanolamine/phosphatidyl-N-methylethanolamine N-methyltransferase
MTVRFAPRKADTDAWLFFRRWLANPRQMGSITPSSPTLARRLARELTIGADEYVVELGGGTGAITAGILAHGIPPERLFVIEINPEMAAHLRRLFPRVTVIEGDARRLEAILPPAVVGRVGTALCGIPMLLLSAADQRAIVDSVFSIMPAGRRLVLYTYKLGSPLVRERLGLEGRRTAWVAANVPPASVWSYRKP